MVTYADLLQDLNNDIHLFFFQITKTISLTETVDAKLHDEMIKWIVEYKYTIYK